MDWPKKYIQIKQSHLCLGIAWVSLHIQKCNHNLRFLHWVRLILLVVSLKMNPHRTGSTDGDREKYLLLGKLSNTGL